jgi:hypothetical protein
MKFGWQNIAKAINNEFDELISERKVYNLKRIKAS